MSMIINLVEDHNIYLCEGGPVYNGGVQPTPPPITYLTQWKIVGNSEVHTDPYLTSWKVSGNSEVHTLPYPDGVVLPNGYKRCKYLTFDGSSYIDTGVTSKSDIEVSTVFLTNTESKCILGARKNNGFPYMYLGIINNTNNTISTGYGGNVIVLNTGKQLADGNKHIVTINKTTITIDEDSFILSSTGNFDENNHNLLGTWMNGNNPDPRYFVGNIYDTIFSNTQGELWHGIPCLDANDVPCFYDIVSQTAFYNQGSGSFTYKLYPQPTEIWSCGDLGQDGKYHVKISNGVDIYDIALDEPLRKVNDVADTIEFPSGTEGKALVTRKFNHFDMGEVSYDKINIPTTYFRTAVSDIKYPSAEVLCAVYPTHPYTTPMQNIHLGLRVGLNSAYPFFIDDDQVELTTSEFKDANAGIEVIYELVTPTTELIDVSPFPVSPTDTYTSANVTPYSAFEHTENKEIWSCGEYNATDGKYHILVQPQGGSVADIALDEPLRKVYNVTDTIEFPSDTERKALVIRNLKQINMSSLEWRQGMTGVSNSYRYLAAAPDSYPYDAVEYILTMNTGGYINHQANNTWQYAPTKKLKLIGTYPPTSSTAIANSSTFVIYDPNYDKEGDLNAFLTYLADKLMIYKLAIPTTELVDAPQIEEADSYTCVISQGGKAVSWSSFETE